MKREIFDILRVCVLLLSVGVAYGFVAGTIILIIALFLKIIDWMF